MALKCRIRLKIGTNVLKDRKTLHINRSNQSELNLNFFEFDQPASVLPRNNVYSKP